MPTNTGKLLVLFLFFSVTNRAISVPRDTLVSQTIKLALPGVMLASVPVLYEAWYKEYAQRNFHFFNDNEEWFQMDKLGHMFTVNLVQDRYSYFLKKAGYTPRKAENLACIYSLGYLTAIEVMDGFSMGWGFSVGDMLANLSGSLLFWGQQKCWGEQKIQMKFSYSPSPYRMIRPALLGNSPLTSVIKDYNGQTYWMSFPLPFLPGKWGKFSMLSLGMGAKGMIGARNNIFYENGMQSNYSHIGRFRCWYLSADINLRGLHSKKKWVNGLLQTFGFIKVPLPAIQYSKPNGFRVLPWMF